MAYELNNGVTCLIEADGERVTLANFTAKIIEEVRYVDGKNTDTYLTIVGQQLNPDSKNIDDLVDLPAVIIKADDFPGMSWAMRGWGVRAVIYPGSGVKEDLRTAIQINSRPKVHTIYRHLGWTEIEKKRAYIHGGGAITEAGNNPNVAVQLPPELARYNLTEGTKGCTSKKSLQDCIAAVLDLTYVGPEEVTWTLIAGTLAPLLGPVDFAIHLTGKTGTYKSELMSLFQSFYGPAMDARHLPGSWSSTANAIEAQTFLAANAAYVLDDFVPNGTASQQRAYQQNADKIIRAQGNQAGRARLTDTAALQTAMYPRGIILSTGEDTPEGHSVRARMIILETSPGDVKLKPLTVAQQKRSWYATCIRNYIMHIAKTRPEIEAATNKYRDQCLELGHARTPGMIGRLKATIDHFLEWCGSTGTDVSGFQEQAHAAINKAAERQRQFLETSDPCDQFIAGIRQVLAVNAGHIRTLNGGIPRSPTQLGWTQLPGDQEDTPSFKSSGPCIGWINWNTNEFMLEVNTGFANVKKQTGTEISLTKQTMLKRLKDSGKLLRVDEVRQRNTVRVTAENHPRQVIVLAVSDVLETQEMESE